MEASWQPDPSGRHQYRWWDGVGWSDAVADKGVQSRDPMDRASTSRPRERTGPTVTVSTTPTFGAPSATPSGGLPLAEPIKMGSGLGKWIALAVVLLAGIGVGVFLLFFRESATTVAPQTGVTTGRVDGLGSYVVRDVQLRAGEAMRYRVEGNPKRDLITYLVTTDATASEWATDYFSAYQTGLGLTDIGEVTTDYADARDVLTDGVMEDDFRGYKVIRNSDRCCKGVPDTDSFIAVVPGTYRIVVIEHDGKDSDVRIVVEVYQYSLAAYTDMSDATETDAFFTDTGFYKDTETYELDAGS